jgi:hypothetical protein
MNRISLLLFYLLLVRCSPSKEGWIELFNGENLDGWHIYGAGNSYDGWYVENGVLTFDYKLRTNSSSSNLVTDSKYTNFELSLDWNISDQGNSGVFWGVIEDEQFDHPYQTGPEIQILDDNWLEYIEVRGDINRAGSLYGLMAPSTIVSKAAGIWNHYLIHIDHNENIGYVVFNEQEVLRFPVHGPEWEAMIAKSGFADWPGFGKAKTGHISLQEHGGKVAFKNIKIKILPRGGNL